MEKGDGQPPKDKDDDPNRSCFVRRFVLRPGEVPGVHQLVKVTEDGVGGALEIGVAAPRAVVRHVGRMVSSGQVQEQSPTEALADEAAPPN